MNLGELEKLVLHYLWKHKNVDVKNVYSYFIQVRGGSLNTYQSTLDRLYKKGRAGFNFGQYLTKQQF
jgi:predicted transcriptional regulator